MHKARMLARCTLPQGSNAQAQIRLWKHVDQYMRSAVGLNIGPYTAFRGQCVFKSVGAHSLNPLQVYRWQLKFMDTDGYL